MSNLNRSMMLRFILSVLMLCGTSSPALAHAKLISSSPANGSSILESPGEVRLTFSEPVEVGMSRAILISGSVQTQLALRQDANNAKTIAADLNVLSPGNYQLQWSALSADGHSMSGVVSFSVVVSGESSPSSQKIPVSVESGMPSSPLLGIAMFLRGFGMTALMAFAGLLFFGKSRSADLPNGFIRLTRALGAAASTALLAHFLVWVLLSSQDTAYGEAIVSVVQTHPGQREAARVLLAVLAVAIWQFARAFRPAILLAAFALVASSVIGHAAAITPVASVSFKAIHLVAAALWLGGVAWLLMLSPDAENVFANEARRVSRAAGICALLVLISGLIQAGIVLSWKPESLTSSYAIVAWMKLAGVALLFMLGAYNRFKLVPNAATPIVANTLRRMAGREVLIMICVAMLGGILSYISPPSVNSELLAITR